MDHVQGHQRSGVGFQCVGALGEWAVSVVADRRVQRAAGHRTEGRLSEVWGSRGQSEAPSVYISKKKLEVAGIPEGKIGPLNLSKKCL